MNYVYMAVDITTFNCNIEPRCYFFERLDGGEVTNRELSLDEARKLMWELELAGGEKTITPSPYSNGWVTRRVDYWARR